MGVFKKKEQNIVRKPSDATVMDALVRGNIITKLSFIICGLGNIVNKQIAKGLAFLVLEIAYIYYMISNGVVSIQNFITLGVKEQGEVYNEQLGIYEYVAGDNSMLCLLYGVITFFLTAAFIFLMVSAGKSAYCIQLKKELGMPVPKLKDDIYSLKQGNLHKLMLAFPIVGVLTFTIVPLVYMILIAFTSYDHEHQPPGNLFDWVGFDNFAALFAQGGKLSNTFWPVLGWTLTWAVFATITCFILGLILALIINRKDTKCKGLWRFMFILSIAIPQFVSLLSMRTIFNTNGPINVILRAIGLIGPTDAVPFFTDPTMAKITIICINIWIGVPYTLLQTTGILQNIPGE